MDLTISSSNAYTLRFDLEAHASLVFPQSCSYSGLHAGGSHLTTCIRVLRRIIRRRASGSSHVRMLSGSTSSHRYSSQLKSRELARKYGNYLVMVAIPPDSSAHPWKRTLGARGLMEKLCCWGIHTGSLEIAHNCQVLVVTVAAAVAHR